MDVEKEVQLPDLTSLMKADTAVAPSDTALNKPRATLADIAPGHEDAAAAPTAVTVAESAKEKQMLLLILAAYADKFPDDLAFIEDELTPAALVGLNLDELRALRDRCDMAVGMNMASENRRQMFNTCIYALEHFTTSMGFNTTGSTARLVVNKDFQKNLARLSLKWLSEKETSAEYAVLGCMITTFAQSYMMNDTAGSAAAPIATATAPVAADDYRDLDNIGDPEK